MALLVASWGSRLKLQFCLHCKFKQKNPYVCLCAVSVYRKFACEGNDLKLGDFETLQGSMMAQFYYLSITCIMIYLFHSPSKSYMMKTFFPWTVCRYGTWCLNIGSAWSHFAYGRAMDNLTIVTKRHVAEVQELSSDVETRPLLILNLVSQNFFGSVPFLKWNFLYEIYMLFSLIWNILDRSMECYLCGFVFLYFWKIKKQ